MLVISSQFLCVKFFHAVVVFCKYIQTLSPAHASSMEIEKNHKCVQSRIVTELFFLYLYTYIVLFILAPGL